VILINLLPHREAARKRRKEQFFLQIGVSALVGGVVCGLIYTWYQGMLYTQQDRNQSLQAEIAKLDAEIKNIASLQAEIASLRARQGAVEDLQSDRNLPVFLFEDLAHQLPEGVYLTSMRQENSNVLLSGVAQSQERVSELLRNLGNSSTALKRPELIEIVASTVLVSPKEQRRVSNFTIRAQLTRPEQKVDEKLNTPPKG